MKLQVDVIKILATGGVLSYGDVWDVPQFNLDEVQAVVEESTKFHRKVAAHAHGDEGIAVAVEGGVHSSNTVPASAKRRCTICSSVEPISSRPYGRSIRSSNPATRITFRPAAYRAVASSVRVAYGTDAGIFPHAQNNKDFTLMAGFGMSSIAVMRSATAHAAEMIGTSDRGVLAPGKLADVAVFSGDPSRNVALLETRPQQVLLGGERVDPSTALRQAQGDTSG